MIPCPVCGFRNVSTNVRCLKCGALLKEDAAELTAAFRSAEKRRDGFLPPGLLGLMESLRRRNPLRNLWVLPEHVRYRFPFTAGLLSLVPGLGQVYNRQPRKGALFAGLWMLGIILSLLTLREPWSNAFLLLVLLGWLLIWNDSIASAVRINGELWSFRNSVALWFAAMFATGVLVSAAQFFGMNLISLVRVMDAAHEPHLHKGEIVLTNHMAYWFSGPAYGEVVYYDPGRFTAHQATGSLMPDSASINIKDYYQRVSGLPGDRIEKTGGKLMRNGKPVPAALLPFGAEVIPDGESFTVPPECYWIPVTGIPSDFFGSILEAPSPTLFQKGWVFKGWREASLVTKEAILGRAVAVINPPEQRRWLAP